MLKTTMKSFVKSFVALIQGDDATVKAEKVFRQVESALKSQTASLAGDTINLEDKVTACQEALANARINNGESMTDRNTYVRNLLAAKNSLTMAEEELANHKTKIEFLEEELRSLTAEVDA